ncbi:MAG: DASH family cryptochrome [Candidatus Limnocylindrales bacterium]
MTPHRPARRVRPVIVWFRNDLRLHDHAPLLAAAASGHPVLPLYVVDPRHYDRGVFGYPRTGPYRARFLLEALIDLRSSLQARGSELAIRRGPPEAVIPELVAQTDANALYLHAEAAPEERAVERALADALHGSATVLVEHGASLYHPTDLPFEPARTPDVFTRFRKAVERSSTVRAPLAEPERMPPVPEVEAGDLPTLAELHLPEPTADPRAVLDFRGGETTGLARIDDYIWQRDLLRRYKQTRNGMLGGDYSSKLSPWLALGCVSPRRVYAEVLRYEQERVRNDSTYWLVFELLWRDFFRFTTEKQGARMLRASGMRGVELPWSVDEGAAARWREGRTGYPLVDANMRELAATGFMSNRGRQNVASFLTKNLGLDWRIGAEWFESQLVDYDACSNWGNWNYTAGVGNDARGFRYFDTAKQARDYDRDGRYVKHWLPELAGLPSSRVHEPWKASTAELSRAGIELGRTYPRPIVDFWDSIRRQEAAYEVALAEHEQVG